MDDSSELIHTEPPSLSTTKRLVADAGDYDFVMHIGDISYAEGFASTVSRSESGNTPYSLTSIPIPPLSSPNPIVSLRL